MPNSLWSVDGGLLDLVEGKVLRNKPYVLYCKLLQLINMRWVAESCEVVEATSFAKIVHVLLRRTTTVGLSQSIITRVILCAAK
jgi:hypothetical protein